MSDINEFTQEKTCVYKGELYSVRDNGAVMRHRREGAKKRPLDEVWTFGRENDKKYLFIGGVQVHRIVATAFHGEAPSDQHIVDHIDTNHCNNRPENLQWLTKLENAILNPHTRRKIEFYCGSVDAFLKDPSILRSAPLSTDLEWMRTVTKEEANNALKNLEKLLACPARTSGTVGMGEWLFAPSTRKPDALDEAYGIRRHAVSMPIAEEQPEKTEIKPEVRKKRTTGKKKENSSRKKLPEPVLFTEDVKVKSIKVRFVDVKCDFCGCTHYIYLVTGLVTDSGMAYETLEDLHPLNLNIDAFDPVIQSNVKRYFSAHPELNYPMGEIKIRHSRTMNEDYMSFGCPECDGIYGQWYVDEVYWDYVYEADDDNVHQINIEGPELVVKCISEE